MNIAYLDDDQIDSLSFKRKASKLLDNNNYNCYNTVAEFTNTQINYDIIFSDIILKNESLNNFSAQFGNTYFVSVSSNAHLAKKISSPYYFGHLAKPIQKEDIQKTIALYNIVTRKSLEQSKTVQPNLNYLKTLSAGDIEFEIGLLDIFLNEFPTEMETIKNLVQSNNNNEQLVFILHKIKSKINLLGMKELFYAVDHVEKNMNLGIVTKVNQKLLNYLLTRMPIMLQFVKEQSKAITNS